MKKYLTYLASPYSPRETSIPAEQVSIKEARFNFAAEATVALFAQKPKWNVFSPIVHSHVLHLKGMAGDWKTWGRIDKEYIRLSERLVVLCIRGWRESTGVQAEIKFARRTGVPVFFMDPLSFEISTSIPHGT